MKKQEGIAKDVETKLRDLTLWMGEIEKAVALLTEREKLAAEERLSLKQVMEHHQTEGDRTVKKRVEELEERIKELEVRIAYERQTGLTYEQLHRMVLDTKRHVENLAVRVDWMEERNARATKREREAHEKRLVRMEAELKRQHDKRKPRTRPLKEVLDEAHKTWKEAGVDEEIERIEQAIKDGDVDQLDPEGLQRLRQAVEEAKRRDQAASQFGRDPEDEPGKDQPLAEAQERMVERVRGFDQALVRLKRVLEGTGFSTSDIDEVLGDRVPKIRPRMMFGWDETMDEGASMKGKLYGKTDPETGEWEGETAKDGNLHLPDEGPPPDVAGTYWEAEKGKTERQVTRDIEGEKG